MGIFDGFLDKMKLSSDDDDYENDDMMDDEDEVSNVRQSRKSRSEDIFTDKDDEEDVRPAAKPKPQRSFIKQSSGSRVVSMNKSSNRNMEVCVFKPNNIEDGRDISDTLLAGKAVVLNLEGLDISLAQRIIDFTSGACYSIRGNLQKVSNFIFIVTPESVDISGDFQELFGGDFSFHQGSGF